MKRIVVGITGASGVQLALHVLKAFRAQQDVELHVVMSEGAKLALHHETDLSEEDFMSLSDAAYGENDMAACLASGSFEADGMVVVPCSMKTLSAIANAYDANLIVRAADVCLKERRKLVVVPREAPFSNAHLRNMLTVSQDGAVVIAPVLSFYLSDNGIEGQLDQIAGKILAQFGMRHEGFTSWNG